MQYVITQDVRVGSKKKKRGARANKAVGCCTLRFEHVRFEPPNTVHFDFLGKSSTRYQNSVKVDSQVYENLLTFKENKTEKDEIFNKLYVSILSNFL